MDFKIKIRIFKDKQSGAWVYHSKKYDISGYGQTRTKARKMFNEVVEEILKQSVLKPF